MKLRKIRISEATGDFSDETIANGIFTEYIYFYTPIIYDSNISIFHISIDLWIKNQMLTVLSKKW